MRPRTHKELLHAMQQKMLERTGLRLGKSHLRELLAAACGCNTWAGLTSGYVLLDIGEPPPELTTSKITHRCVQLGYDEAQTSVTSVALANHLEYEGIFAMRIRDLVGVIRSVKMPGSLHAEQSQHPGDEHLLDDEEHDETRPEFVDDITHSELARHGLEELADKGNPDATAALRLLKLPSLEVVM
ncbi:hypothetical protein [Ottowia testudinis]|uniref:Uncharacterized protein n=1 Tax=Ottowia testudinis TaxID=2816950 RepID=A0A975CG00_9BURK|nr:hypothetical protein [Ottowia testudinis]QTD44396.1 hypothetical protein J1M35_14995 [Ottowia testudinis]